MEGSIREQWVSLTSNNFSRMNWERSWWTWFSINGGSIVLMGTHEMITSIEELWFRLSDLQHEILVIANYPVWYCRYFYRLYLSLRPFPLDFSSPLSHNVDVRIQFSFRMHQVTFFLTCLRNPILIFGVLEADKQFTRYQLSFFLSFFFLSPSPSTSQYQSIPCNKHAIPRM